MKILSIDTSSPICAVAILENDKLIKEISQNNGLTHSEKLMPIIDQILKEANLELKDIDLIVCDKGPGSFTGIRIGIATVKAFTDSLNIPSIGISSLEALCYNSNSNGLICSIIDAKNDNAYWGLYEKDNNNYKTIYEPSADNILDILSKLFEQTSPITFVGDGLITYKDQILKSINNCKFEKENDLSAYNLGLAGFNKYKESQNITEELLPLYLKAPKAQILMEAKQNG